MAGLPNHAREDWSKADEQRFVEMAQRRQRVTEARCVPVNLMAQAICGMSVPLSQEFLANFLITNADEIRDILAPFDSGVRPSKEG